MSNEKTQPCCEKFKTMIGGQALIEGILMRGPEKDATVVRTAEGLQVEALICGEPGWDEKQRCLRQQVTAKCTAWLLAVSREETAFLDFELRGGWKH